MERGLESAGTAEGAEGRGGGGRDCRLWATASVSRVIKAGNSIVLEGNACDRGGGGQGTRRCRVGRRGKGVRAQGCAGRRFGRRALASEMQAGNRVLPHGTYQSAGYQQRPRDRWHALAGVVHTPLHAHHALTRAAGQEGRKGGSEPSASVLRFTGSAGGTHSSCLRS